MQTYYHILNISPHASDEDVRRAYRTLAMRWHPDRNPNDRKKAAAMFDQIHRAYVMLQTKPQRSAYNRRLLQHIQRQQTTPQSIRPIAAKRALIAIREIFWPLAPNTKETGHV